VPDAKEEIEKIHHLRDISIWIDIYDDIFSDFDPRNFSERNISDDFLYEVKRVSLESNFHIGELKLLIPEKNRNAETENTITKRLHSHFKKSYTVFQGKMKSNRKKGLLLSLIGMVMMVGANYVSSLRSESFLMHSLLVLLEPAGWFMVWVGLENLFGTSRELKPEFDFYNKLSKSKIEFVSI
jgi:hypothetical protein